MSAIHAAMAGASAGSRAGAAERKKFLEKIDQTFDSPETRLKALVVAGMIEKSTESSPWTVLFFFCFGSAAMYCGGMLGNTIAGENGGIAGYFIGLFLFGTLVYYVDRCILRSRAKRKLQQLIEADAEWGRIKEKVMKIL